MKKITFFNFKKLVMTVVAFMGCASLSYGQGDWSLVSEEDLTSTTSMGTSELLASLPENYYANIPGSGSYGELKYNVNYKENGIYPLYLISNGDRGDFFCIKSTLEPGEYRFTFRAKYPSTVNVGNLSTNINNDTQSGATASATDKTATFPITIPSDLSVGEMVVVRFIICKTADGATYDGDPCSTTATELNYCDYVVKIAEEGAADVDAVSVSSLAGGVYIAVVDGKVVKFVK